MSFKLIYPGIRSHTKIYSLTDSLTFRHGEYLSAEWTHRGPGACCPCCVHPALRRHGLEIGRKSPHLFKYSMNKASSLIIPQHRAPVTWSYENSRGMRSEGRVFHMWHLKTLPPCTGNYRNVQFPKRRPN